jgi:hypothetical protein
VLILSARKIATQAMLFDIPKFYIPINENDLPRVRFYNHHIHDSYQCP